MAVAQLPALARWRLGYNIFVNITLLDAMKGIK